MGQIPSGRGNGGHIRWLPLGTGTSEEVRCQTRRAGSTRDEGAEHRAMMMPNVEGKSLSSGIPNHSGMVSLSKIK
jgi:hypothetical protein